MATLHNEALSYSPYPTGTTESSVGGRASGVMALTGIIFMLLGLTLNVEGLLVAGFASSLAAAAIGVLSPKLTNNFEEKWGMPHFTSEDHSWNYKFADKLLPWLQKELPSLDICKIYTSTGSLTVDARNPVMLKSVEMIKSEDPETMQANLYRAVNEIEKISIEMIEAQTNKERKISTGEWFANSNYNYKEN